MDKKEIIARIKELVEKHDSPSFSEMEVESSPCIYSLGDTIILVESVSYNDVTAVTYSDDEEEDENDIPYEDLDDEILNEILEILEKYDVESDKTWERCED
jgi:hypothetical protein